MESNNNNVPAKSNTNLDAEDKIPYYGKHRVELLQKGKNARLIQQKIILEQDGYPICLGFYLRINQKTASLIVDDANEFACLWDFLVEIHPIYMKDGVLINIRQDREIKDFDEEQKAKNKAFFIEYKDTLAQEIKRSRLTKYEKRCIGNGFPAILAPYVNFNQKTVSLQFKNSDEFAILWDLLVKNHNKYMKDGIICKFIDTD